MAKPVFGQFCNDIAKRGGGKDMLPSWLDSLNRFYECYTDRYLHSATGLYLWANDIAIGVDDDPASWGRPPFSSASLFLNCFMYKDLIAAAELGQKSGRKKLSEIWHSKADHLKKAINKFCWDKRDGIFYSVDTLCRQNLSNHRLFGQLNINLEPFWKCLPLKVMSWSCFLPMWCEIASPEQAEQMVNEHLLNVNRFWSDFGIRTLSADEKMYSPAAGRGNPSNWLGPIWIISNYIIHESLKNYGFDASANELAIKTKKLLYADFNINGHLHENYNPETGKGISAPGFWNWNMLALV